MSLRLIWASMSPDSRVSRKGYFEKEIFVGNPVVVIGVYYNPFPSKNSDFEPEIFCAQFRVRLM